MTVIGLACILHLTWHGCSSGGVVPVLCSDFDCKLSLATGIDWSPDM